MYKTYRSFSTVLSRLYEQEKHSFRHFLSVVFIAGIICYFYLPFEPSLWIFAATAFLTALYFLLNHINSHRNFVYPVSVVVLVLCLFLTGISASKIENMLDSAQILETDVENKKISGTVDRVDVLPDGIKVTLLNPKIESIPIDKTPKKIRVRFKELSLSETPKAGSVIGFTGSLKAVSEKAAPMTNDFRRQYYYDQLGASGWSDSNIKIISDAKPADTGILDSFNFTLENARKIIAKRVYERLSGDVAAVTAAKMTGEQSMISEETNEAMRVSGLIHLLATSGANVTIMGLLIYFPIRLLLALFPPIALRYNIKKIAAFGAILSAAGFTFLVGANAATVRSLVMVIIAMIAVFIDRHTTSLQIVISSAVIGLLLVPSAAIGASFQMSFAAVFCLIALSYSESQKRYALEEKPFLILLSLLIPVWIIIRTSIISTVSIAPFSIFHFNAFSLYGILANIVAVPITSFCIMPWTIFAYLSIPFGLEGFFIDMAAVGNAFTIAIAHAVAGLEHSTFYASYMPPFSLVLISLGGFAFCIFKSNIKFIFLIPVVLGFLYPLYTPLPDILVSPSRTMVGVFTNSQLIIFGKREKFILSQWQQILANPDTINSSAIPDVSAETHDKGCSKDFCFITVNDYTVFAPVSEKSISHLCRSFDPDKHIILNTLDTPSCLDGIKSQNIIQTQKLDSSRGAAVFFLNKDGIRAEFSDERAYERPWSP
ncbi:MAG: ComEC/Rec2 family competence protein [Alphaproteobacteria bacterium]|nr:ComEC/Rec2 family competence protein [Alphaproteobacteria bacterium]MCL2505138.1 ComEC/Rec2 family competence protein [Alphaproteobacteria bacterium]